MVDLSGFESVHCCSAVADASDGAAVNGLLRDPAVVVAESSLFATEIVPHRSPFTRLGRTMHSWTATGARERLGESNKAEGGV